MTIRSMPATPAFRENYDRIFRKERFEAGIDLAVGRDNTFLQRVSEERRRAETAWGRHEAAAHRSVAEACGALPPRDPADDPDA